MTNTDGQDAKLEIHGPFQVNKFTVGGYLIPHLAGQFTQDGETLSLVLDGRFGVDVPKEIADSVVWFIANALALGSGYSCFGENSQEFNRFKCKLYRIDGPNEQAVEFFDDDKIE